MPTPTGRIFRSEDSLFDLTLTRTFVASPEEVWDDITNPERTAEWFGAWRGEVRPGALIEVQMHFEEGEPWFPARIETCEAPHLLALSVIDESGDWEVQLRLTQLVEQTELTFVHHLADSSAAESMGPGWEYYLDNLVAAREGQPLPDFADYYPSQSEYYVAEANRAAAP